MNEKIANNYVGLMDYKELWEDTLSSTWETDWKRWSISLAGILRLRKKGGLELQKINHALKKR